MADFDLEVLLKVQDKATKQLQKFNKELDKTKKKIKEVNRTSLNVKGGGGTAGGETAGGGGVSGIGLLGGGIGLSSVMFLLGQIANGANIAAHAFKLLVDSFGAFTVASKKGLSAQNAFNSALEYAKEHHDKIVISQNKIADAIERSTKLKNRDTQETKENTKAKKDNNKQNKKSAFGFKKLALSMGLLYATWRSLKSIATTGGAFEDFRDSLVTITGSVEDAQLAFKFVQDLASKLPTTVSETTEAFIKMSALGIAPTEKRLISFSNTASASNKTLMQFVEAVADAAVGEFERLKEFGIKASTETDKYVLRFRGQTIDVNKNASSIVDALDAIGNSGEVNGQKINGFAGATERKLGNLNQKVSNFGDAFDRLKDTIFRGGLGDGFKTLVDLATRFVTALSNSWIYFQQFGIGVAGVIGRIKIELKYFVLQFCQSVEIAYTNVMRFIENTFEKSVYKLSKIVQKIYFWVPGVKKILEVPKPVLKSYISLTDNIKKLNNQRKSELEIHQKSMGQWALDVDLRNKQTGSLDEYNKRLEEQRKKEQELAEQQQRLLKLREKATKFIDDNKTAIEQYKETVKDLNTVLTAGLITQEQYNLALKKAKDEASNGVFEETRTDAENLAIELNRLDNLLDEGIITWDEYSRAVFNAWDELEDKSKETTNKINDFFIEGARSVEQAFSDYFFDPFDEGLKGLVNSVADAMKRIAANIVASDLAMMLFGDYQKTNQFGGAIGSLIGRASGGPMIPGEAYQLHAGEIVIPQIPQYVYPSKPAFEQATGGTSSYNIQIVANDAASFREMVKNDERWFVDTVTSGARKFNKGGF